MEALESQRLQAAEMRQREKNGPVGGDPAM
jgi:hypothetical protein